MAAKKKIEKVENPPMTELKNLPRNDDGSVKRTFIANGTEYIIRNAGDILSAKRLTFFNKFRMQAAMGMDFSEFLEANTEVDRRIHQSTEDPSTRTAALMKNWAIRKAVAETRDNAYDIWYWVCTIFIVRADEDLRYFNEDYAFEKIKDWDEEGFRVNDFFSLGANTIPNFAIEYSKIQLEVAANKDISI